MSKDTEKITRSPHTKDHAQKFHSFLPYISDAFLLFDLDQARVIDINDESCRIFGLSRSEFLSAPIDRILPHGLSRLRSITQKISDTHENWFGELVFLNGSGELIPIKISVSVMRSFKTSCVLAILRPQEIKKGYHDIVRRGRLFDSMLQAIVHPFYIINADDYTIEVANPAARQDRDLSACRCYEVTHKRPRPCAETCACPLEIIKRTKRPVRVEHVHYDAKGEARVYEVNGYPIFDEAGQVKQIIEYSIDITEQKQQAERLAASEKNYRQLYEGSRDGYALVDMQGRLQQFNRAFREMLGYSSEELHHLTYEDLTPEKWHAKEAKILKEQVRVRGYSQIYEKEYQRKDGTAFPVELRTYLVKDPQGEPIGMWAFVRDITQRRQSEDQLRDLHQCLSQEKLKLEQVLGVDQKLSSILDLNQLVDFIIEKATAVLDAERCSLMLLDQETRKLLVRGAKGLAEERIKTTRIKLGDPIAGLVAERGEPLLVEDIESWRGVKRRNRKDYRSKSFLSVPIKVEKKLIGVVNLSEKRPDHEGGVFSETDLKILCAIVRQAAISIENAYYYRRLEHLSTRDPLTDIYNYRYFINILDQEVDRLKRYPRPLSVLMIDVDDFKSYNDTYGHLAGDQLLKTLSSRIKAQLRSVDIFCRYAGDEFVVILPETDILQAKVVADKILTGVRRIKLKRKISVSIGAALCAQHCDRRDLIMKADQSLYKAKRQGRDRLCSLS